MVTMVVLADKLDYEEFHKWLDTFEPGWSWMLPHRKGYASTVRDSQTNQVSDLEWAIEHEVKTGKLLASSYVGEFRVHYKFSTRERAMMAKLRWGHMKPYRLGAVRLEGQAIAKTDGDSE